MWPGCLGGIPHYLSLQRSWLLRTATRQWWSTLTVHSITNTTLWGVSEPSDFMRFKYSDCWGVWRKYLRVIGLKYSWNYWTRDCHAVTAATRLGLIITVKCEPSNNNLPRRMIWWALHWLESYKSLEDRRFNAYQVWYFTGIGQGLNLSILFCFF